MFFVCVAVAIHTTLQSASTVLQQQQQSNKTTQRIAVVAGDVTRNSIIFFNYAEGIEPACRTVLFLFPTHLGLTKELLPLSAGLSLPSVSAATKCPNNQQQLAAFSKIRENESERAARRESRGRLACT
ncbi:Hypothetical predicted protein [Cloeon dipterum]|uniref:Secreted protein n=1 Tax=Cloeon dipterum TaxID=197152 RepID=A0A8S1C5Z0_9INSE|nr:Hypothetical predicted protein [Cloeon dipterum]